MESAYDNIFCVAGREINSLLKRNDSLYHGVWLVRQLSRGKQMRPTIVRGRGTLGHRYPSKVAMPSEDEQALSRVRLHIHLQYAILWFHVYCWNLRDVKGG